jgi:copper chaperone CopZ
LDDSDTKTIITYVVLKFTIKPPNIFIIDVSANLMTKKLTVKIDEESERNVTPEMIEELVREMGKECDFDSSEITGKNNKIQKNSFKKIISENRTYFPTHYLEQIEPDVKTYYLSVTGMSCSSCEGNLTKKVIALNGAIEANFSVLTKQAKVSIDINKLSIRQVIDVINFGKFTAVLKEKSNKVDIRDSIEKE